MGFIVGFEDSQALDPQIVGRKFAALARAAREGFDVPEAVAIETKAHAHFLATEQWPAGLREEVVEAARRLQIPQGLSIRSSATLEDLAGQGFAGQYRSFLEVKSEHELLHRIEECWESAKSETVRSYLQALNVQGADVREGYHVIPGRVVHFSFPFLVHFCIPVDSRSRVEPTPKRRIHNA